MVLGGVPFYLSKMEKGEGVAQNIDRLLFAEDGELHDEFKSLYDQNEVLDILEYEIQSWSKRKEQMFKRGLLSNALNYLKTASMN